MRAGPFVAVALCAGALGCGPPALVSLRDAVPVTATPPNAIPLEVITRSSGVRDPVPLAGGRARFTGLDESLTHAVATAAVPWAEAHRADRPDGWQLTVELTQADAQLEGARITVTLGVRATLRTRTQRRYLAQTQAHCRQAALVDVPGAAPVFYDCMMTVGRELAGWLGGVAP